MQKSYFCIKAIYFWLSNIRHRKGLIPFSCLFKNEKKGSIIMFNNDNKILKVTKEEKDFMLKNGIKRLIKSIVSLEVYIKGTYENNLLEDAHMICRQDIDNQTLNPRNSINLSYIQGTGTVKVLSCIFKSKEELLYFVLKNPSLVMNNKINLN